MARQTQVREACASLEAALTKVGAKGDTDLTRAQSPSFSSADRCLLR
jgi:hypothetical protein